MEFLWSLIIMGSIAPITYGIFWAIGKTKAFSPRSPDFAPPLEPKDYKRIHLTSTGIAVLAIVISSLTLFALLGAVAELYYAGFDPSAIIIKMPIVALGIPALFLGILLPAIPLERLFHRLWGNKYQSYKVALDRNFKVNIEKLSHLFCVLGVSLSVLASWRIIWATSYLLGDTIHVRRLLSIVERQYSIKDVAKIIRSQTYIAPNGKRFQVTSYHVLFSDGWRWDLTVGEAEDAFASAVSERSGINIVDEEVE